MADSRSGLGRDGPDALGPAPGVRSRTRRPSEGAWKPSARCESCPGRGSRLARGGRDWRPFGTRKSWRRESLVPGPVHTPLQGCARGLLGRPRRGSRNAPAAWERDPLGLAPGTPGAGRGPRPRNRIAERAELVPGVVDQRSCHVAPRAACRLAPAGRGETLGGLLGAPLERSGPRDRPREPARTGHRPRRMRSVSRQGSPGSGRLRAFAHTRPRSSPRGRGPSPSGARPLPKGIRSAAGSRRARAPGSPGSARRLPRPGRSAPRSARSAGRGCPGS